MPRCRDLSPRGLLALCRNPKTQIRSGAVALAQGCERGVQVNPVSFRAPVTGHPAISRGQDAVRGATRVARVGPVPPAARARGRRRSLPRAALAARSDRALLGRPSGQLPADIQAARTWARRANLERATLPAVRHEQLASSAIAGSVFSSRSWRAESCPGRSGARAATSGRRSSTWPARRCAAPPCSRPP